MNFDIKGILEKFDSSTRLGVLLILVVGTCGVTMYSMLVNSEGYNCLPIMRQNAKLHEEYARMSQIVIDLQMINANRKLRAEIITEGTPDPIMASPEIDTAAQPAPPIVTTKSDLVDVEEELLKEMNEILSKAREQ